MNLMFVGSIVTGTLINV